MEQRLCKSLSIGDTEFIVLFNSKCVKKNYICIFSRLTASVRHIRSLKTSK